MAAQRFSTLRPWITRPISLSRLSYRSFSLTSSLRNEPYVPGPIPGQYKPPIPPLGPPRPTQPPKNRLALLRRVPWKTLIILGLFVYGVVQIDSSLKETIHAVQRQFTVPERTWLYLNLNDLHITESPHSEKALQLMPFVSSAGKRRMTVLEITTTLRSAAADPRVKGNRVTSWSGSVG
jgi:hypothetical protein